MKAVVDSSLSFVVTFTLTLFSRLFTAPAVAWDAARFSAHLARCPECRVKFKRYVEARRDRGEK